MAEHYQKGSYVRYTLNGVCLIEDIKWIKSPFFSEAKEFYVLKPIADPESTLFVPTDNEALTSKMRPILSREDVDAAILSAQRGEITWIDDRNQRASSFQNIIRGYDQRESLRLVSCLYLRKQQLEANKKKLSATDNIVLKKAESLIEEEFSFVLHVDKDQIGEYIREKLETGRKDA